MTLRRAGLGLLVGAILCATSAATAGPALVFEPYNGTVFYAEDPDVMWFPASLTKLMTAYVAFQAMKDGSINPDIQLICSKEATQQAPSKLWLKDGRGNPPRPCAEGAHRQIGQRCGGDDRRSRRRQSGGLRRQDERGGATSRHDAHAFRQRQRLACGGTVHHGARFGRAGSRHHRRVPRARSTSSPRSRSRSASRPSAPITGCWSACPAPTA